MPTAVALVGTLVNHRAAFVPAEAARMFCEIAGAHGICPTVHNPVPEFASLAGGDWIHRIPRDLVALADGLYNPIPRPTAVPGGQHHLLCTTRLRHWDTSRLRVPYVTPWHGHHGPHPPFPDNDDPWPAAVRESLDQCAEEYLHYCRREQGPTSHPGWREALVNLFHTTGTRDPRLRLIHPTRAKQDAHTGPRVTLGGLHLHVGGYRRKGDPAPYPQGSVPPAGGPHVHPSGHPCGRGTPGAQRGRSMARTPAPAAPRNDAGVAGDNGRPMRPSGGASAGLGGVGDSYQGANR